MLKYQLLVVNMLLKSDKFTVMKLKDWCQRAFNGTVCKCSSPSVCRYYAAGFNETALIIVNNVIALRHAIRDDKRRSIPARKHVNERRL
jgi:hypothetical protein